ncbi:ABC-2 transporter permease [Clostridium gasigenes]|uniref:ABC-2 transporter permease n=1 Tax=Clostridium gasigenes TaxID=94869 RepID=UPI00143853FE|nr:ABC-2 transporter permease [Clostridium gasigenes]MBU3131392.1 ABC-2 transporter permease [Clostridium gasigenes]NKF08395.1 ABC-2 transporter permease [Clostridium gasigenes]QSW18640.1 ABC-2 transporter permease [Clostridium gasigenes]
MNNIVNLTKGYIETIITIKKQFIFIGIAAVIFGVIGEQFIVYSPAVAVILLVNQVLAYEDISKIDFLVALLPVRKKEYVISRYIGALIALIISIIPMTISYLLANLVNQSGITLSYVYFLIITITSSTVMISAVIPINLKYGQKGRLITTLAKLLPLVLAMSMVEVLSSSNTFITIIRDPTTLILGVLVLDIILIFISYFIAAKLYENKEVKK